MSPLREKFIEIPCFISGTTFSFREKEIQTQILLAQEKDGSSFKVRGRANRHRG